MKTGYHAKEEKRLQLLIEIIANDLKLRRLLYFLDKKSSNSSFLELRMHDKIFELIGIEEQKINDELRKWYFQLTKDAVSVDINGDEEKLFIIAADLLVKLNSKRFE